MCHFFFCLVHENDVNTPIFDTVHKVTSSRVSFTQAKNLASGSKAIIK